MVNTTSAERMRKLREIGKEEDSFDIQSQSKGKSMYS